jgi:hypothetical protein
METKYRQRNARGLILRPVGIGKLFECLEHTARLLGKSVRQLRVLDSCAGVGTYTSPLVGRCHVTALETCEELLLKLGVLVSSASGGRVVRGTLLGNTFENDSFDVVLLHEDIQMCGSPRLAEALVAAAHRLLSCGGALFIVNIDPVQVDGLWYARDLLPEAAERAAQKCISNTAIFSAGEQLGFCIDSLAVPTGPMVMRDIYADSASFLAKWFRDACLVCNEARDAELDAAVAKVVDMQTQKTAREFMLQHDRARDVLGQCTIIVLVVPLSCKYSKAYRNPVLTEPETKNV